MSKLFDDDVMSASYDIIFIFAIYGQCVVLRKSDSGSIVCNTYIVIKRNLSPYKDRKQN